jgi:hypothetical protein
MRRVGRMQSFSVLKQAVHTVTTELESDIEAVHKPTNALRVRHFLLTATAGFQSKETLNWKLRFLFLTVNVGAS